MTDLYKLSLYNTMVRFKQNEKNGPTCCLESKSTQNDNFLSSKQEVCAVKYRTEVFMHSIGLY